MRRCVTAGSRIPISNSSVGRSCSNIGYHLRWRQRMGEAKLTALIQESLSVATRTEAMKPKDLARVVVSPVRLAAHVSVELRQGWQAGVD